LLYTRRPWGTSPKLPASESDSDGAGQKLMDKHDGFDQKLKTRDVKNSKLGRHGIKK